MTADEIRGLELGCEVGSLEYDRQFFQREIAAQLAELNQYLREARVMLVKMQGIEPPNIPLIGGK